MYSKNLYNVGASSNPSCCFFFASRAIAVKLEVLPGPGSETTTDSGFAVMNGTPCLSVLRSLKERAETKFMSVSILPESNAGNPGKIRFRDIASTYPSLSFQPDHDMTENILSVPFQPGKEIVGDAFLAPPPSFTTMATLQTILIGHERGCTQIIHTLVVR